MFKLNLQMSHIIHASLCLAACGFLLGNYNVLIILQAVLPMFVGIFFLLSTHGHIFLKWGRYRRGHIVFCHVTMPHVLCVLVKFGM